MTPPLAGRVGRAHGLDGSFYVDGAAPELLAEGAQVTVAGEVRRIVRRAGTDLRPIVRLDGVDGRDLRGQELVAGADTEPAEGEFGFAELVGCEVPGIGVVRRVVTAPSCELLEVGDDGVLVPFVSDAVRRVDTAARVIEVDLRFLGLAGSAADAAGTPVDPAGPPAEPARPPADPAPPPADGAHPPADAARPPAEP